METKTVDGKPISLADYRGKLVLLYFYMSQMSAGSFDFKVLKELQDSYGKEEKLVILGLSLDANPQAAELFAKANDLEWIQAYLGEWGQTQVPATFGVEGIPTAILIDGQGRLAARNLRGSSMRTAVRNALTANANAPVFQ